MKATCRKATKLGVLVALGYGTKLAIDNALELKKLGKEEFLERKQRGCRNKMSSAGINWGLGHVGVTVANFERAVQWYDRVFGLKLMNYLEITGEDLKPV